MTAPRPRRSQSAKTPRTTTRPAVTTAAASAQDAGESARPRKRSRPNNHASVDTAPEPTSPSTQPPTQPASTAPIERAPTPIVDPALLAPGRLHAENSTIDNPGVPAFTGPGFTAPLELMNQLRLMEERLVQAEARAAAVAAQAAEDPSSAPPVASGSRGATFTSLQRGNEPIRKPKGSAGGGKRGFHLQEEMGLDSEEGGNQYNMILATVRELAHAARLDLSRPYRAVRPEDLHNIFATARKIHPYLARFENDWATAEILKQFMNSVRRYGRRKGYFSCAAEASAAERRRLDGLDDD